MLADQFEAQRSHLWAVAYRMLGSESEAEDAVQEAWIRLHRSGTSGVENIRGWLSGRSQAAAKSRPATRTE